MKREQAEKIVYCGHTRDDYIALEVAMCAPFPFKGDYERCKKAVTDFIEPSINNLMRKPVSSLRYEQKKFLS